MYNKNKQGNKINSRNILSKYYIIKLSGIKLM
jgi:hypothetical protein